MWEPFSCLQPQYNLLTRSTEWELLPVCVNEGLGVMPWSPLRGGWLSGKFRRGMVAPPGGTRVETAENQGGGESWSNVENEATWRTIDALLEVAEDVRKTPAQVAINWLLCQPGVTSPIVGARTVAQLEDNLGATGWALSDLQVAKLNEASATPLPYPYDVLKQISFPRRHTS